MRSKLKEQRIKLGYTQKKISELTGIERTKYTRIENKQCGVSVEDAFVIAKTLCSTVEELFASENVNNNHNLPTGTDS